VPEQELLKTPLYDFHTALGAKMVGFSGYHLPISYPAGIVKEHIHTRKKAALFDVSHMGQFSVSGDGAALALEKLMPADLSSLDVGKMVYTILTNDRGGIIDDLIVSRDGEDSFFMVVNGARKAVDGDFIRRNLPESIKMHEHAAHALIALQGPESASVLERFSQKATALSFMEHCHDDIAGISCRISRAGYTGEDGFELSCAGGDAEALAKALTECPEIIWAGLGARDTLRLEAGLRLYGNDIDETTTPAEAGLSWSIPKIRREKGGFTGDSIILPQIIEKSTSRVFRAFLPQTRMPVRQGEKIFSKEGEEIGIITSGGFSPIKEAPIAMGYINKQHAALDTAVIFKPRGKEMEAVITSLPFVKQNYFRS
jgi:aminomethyltransferase